MRFLLTHGLDEAAEKQPDNTAFRFPPDSINYAQLSQRSNQLANLLIDQGVKKSDRVGIFMHKSLQLPVAIYAVMKAGAAYVPIDPLTPTDRINHIVNDCKISVLISDDSKQKQLQSKWLKSSTISVVVGVSFQIDHLLTFNWSDLSNYPQNTPQVNLNENDLAYIIFTSGSTGSPKGIMHNHRSGLNYAKLSASIYDLCSNDVLSNFSSLHFDMSTMDYLTVTQACATTVIISEAYMKLPASLAGFMEKEQFTIWYSVPFALIQLLAHGQLEDRNLESIRWVLYGGEPFPAKHLRQLMNLWPGARFSNVYGPAEVNQCTYYHLPDSFKGNEQTIPIGQICPNTKGLILDDDDNIIESGLMPGELLIHSASMMQGYWNNRSLNQSCFYKHETYPGVYEHYYRTGDMVSWDTEGQLVLHGRKDRQIKLRGYRIELDEIESIFGQLHLIEEAAAYLVDPQQMQLDDSSKYIEVMVTLKQPRQVNLKQLHEHAKDNLPAYARPDSIVISDAFPRTTSGKIDRKKLANKALSTLEKCN